MYVVVMAGGGGTRLWPLSTQERPKPFLPLLGDLTLLQLTVARVLAGSELGLGPDDVWVVADRGRAPLVRAQLPAATVLEEPVGRNTAPAVALAALGIDRPGDDVMVVLPADHLIRDEPRFRAILAAAVRVAAEASGALVTLGIRPTGPETGYGYIVPNESRREVGGVTVLGVERFVEKPARERAVELLAGAGHASWNAGIFVWRRDSIRDALARFAPDIAGQVASGGVGGGSGLDAAYERVRATSIDFAVMEPASAAGLVAVVETDVGWSDLGSWAALLAALGASCGGRVVQAGEVADAGPADLVLRRVDGRLSLEAGRGRGILDAAGPSALLPDARADEAIVRALIDRVAAREAEES